jgi:hypothetical protein
MSSMVSLPLPLRAQEAEANSPFDDLDCWNSSYCGHIPDSLGITAFVRTESNTSVDIVYVQKTTYDRSYTNKTVYIEGLCPTEIITKSIQ